MITDKTHFMPLPNCDWQRVISKLYFLLEEDDDEYPEAPDNPPYQYWLSKFFIQFFDDPDILEIYPTWAANVDHLMAAYEYASPLDHVMKNAESIDVYTGLSIKSIDSIVLPCANRLTTHSEVGVVSIALNLSNSASLQFIAVTLSEGEVVIGGDGIAFFDHIHYALDDVKKVYTDAYAIIG